MIEAGDSYISFVIIVMVLADPTYPVTYRYLEGNKLATAHELMGATARRVTYS